MGVSNKTPEFLKMNPIGKVKAMILTIYLKKSDVQLIHVIIKEFLFSIGEQVPVLETPDGPIFESNAIARYGQNLEDIFALTLFNLPMNLVILTLVLVAAVTCLKPDNPLFGSSLLEKVICLFALISQFYSVSRFVIRFCLGDFIFCFHFVDFSSLSLSLASPNLQEIFFDKYFMFIKAPNKIRNPKGIYHR